MMTRRRQTQSAPRTKLRAISPEQNKPQTEIARSIQKIDLADSWGDTARASCAVGDNVSAMTRILDPFRFVLIALSGWMNDRQLLLIDYLREENRVLREQLGDKRLRFTDDQRRRLAVRAKGLGRKVLVELG